MIRICTDDDLEALYAIINDAARAYKGVIPEDRWHEPYMPMEELRRECRDGVRFWGCEAEGELIGVMGIQDRGDVELIRHAYVMTRRRNQGAGTRLLQHLERIARKPVLIGTWADASWAIRFYEKNGYRVLSREETQRLLKKYWKISERQAATSVVLANAAWQSPSEWVVRWAPLIARGTVLDLACGGGRHSRFFLDRGLQVVAVDREPQDIPGARFVLAHLEDGSPWPLPGERFEGVVVTNYLYRPLFETLKESLKDGGVLIYETFMVGNERYGRPSNPAFLLRPGELLEAFAGLDIKGFAEGLQEQPKPAMIQRLCAVRAG